MKQIYVFLLAVLCSCVTSGMDVMSKLRKKKKEDFKPEKMVTIPATYAPNQDELDYIKQKELEKQDHSEMIATIREEMISNGVRRYVQAHHPGCTPEQEEECLQKIMEEAVERKVKKAILSYVRQNHYVSRYEARTQHMDEDAQRWQSVIDLINFGMLEFDGKGRLVKSEKY